MVVHCQKRVKQKDLDARMVVLDLEELLLPEVIEDTWEYTPTDGTVLRYGRKYRPFKPEAFDTLLDVVKEVTDDREAHYHRDPVVMVPHNWLDAPPSSPQRRPIYLVAVRSRGVLSSFSFEYDSGEEYVLVYHQGYLDCVTRKDFEARFVTHSCCECHGHGEVSHKLGVVTECGTCKGTGIRSFVDLGP